MYVIFVITYNIGGFFMLGATTLGLISGCLGALLGGVIGLVINSNSKKTYASILEFTAGLMLAVVCFTLIPEAMQISNISICIEMVCTYSPTRAYYS